VSDPDHLIELAMREAQRTSNEPVGPNPFAAAAAGQARDILEPAPQKPIEVEKPQPSKFSNLPRDTAINLRWTLRDIDRKRTKLSPVTPDVLKILLELGLIEMRAEVPTLTSEGVRAISSS
jgi:hypothetical protein